MYRTWLYTRVIELDNTENELGRVDHVELIEGFAVGDAVQDLDFQVAIIDEILRLAQDDDLDEEFPNCDFAAAVYDNSYHCHALRELTVYLWARKATLDWEGVEDIEGINDEDQGKSIFAGDLAFALMRVRRAPGEQRPVIVKRPWEDPEHYYWTVLEQNGGGYIERLLAQTGDGSVRTTKV